MKKVKLALTAVAVCAIQYAASAAPKGRSDLPTTVYSTFSRQYPQARISDWEINGDNYVINFVNRDKAASACYSPQGSWLRTETMLGSKDDLPRAVQKGLARTPYAGNNIDRLEKVQEPSNRTFYFVQVDYGAAHFDDFVDGYVLYFGGNGTLRGAFGKSA